MEWAGCIQDSAEPGNNLEISMTKSVRIAALGLINLFETKTTYLNLTHGNKTCY